MPDQPIPTTPDLPATWRPDRTPAIPAWPIPPLLTAMARGLRGLCPACGKTHAFAGYLKVVPTCTNCTAPLGAYRADDAPPYFTIFIVGHILIPVLYHIETSYHPPLWVLAAIFLPVALVMTLALLRPVKGATLGLMLRLGMVKTEDA